MRAIHDPNPLSLGASEDWDNRTLLELLMRRAGPDERAYLMAEAPGAYRRRILRQGRDVPLRVVMDMKEQA
jgi:hypothetical protein